MYTALQAAAAQVDKDLPEGTDYLINMAGRLSLFCLQGMRVPVWLQGFSWVLVRVLLWVQGIACCFSRLARARPACHVVP